MTFLASCADFIKDVGFPAFVALYLLVFFERSLRRLSSAVLDLTLAIKKNGFPPSHQ